MTNFRFGRHSLGTIMAMLLVVLMAWHFWRVRRAGGVVRPSVPGEDAGTERILFLPNLLLREAVAHGRLPRWNRVRTAEQVTLKRRERDNYWQPENRSRPISRLSEKNPYPCC